MGGQDCGEYTLTIHFGDADSGGRDRFCCLDISVYKRLQTKVNVYKSVGNVFSFRFVYAHVGGSAALDGLPA